MRSINFLLTFPQVSRTGKPSLEVAPTTSAQPSRLTPKIRHVVTRIHKIRHMVNVAILWRRTLTHDFDLRTWHTPCHKKVPPTASYNFDTCERILIFFGAEMLSIKQAIKRRFTMLPPIMCASALPASALCLDSFLYILCIIVYCMHV